MEEHIYFVQICNFLLSELLVICNLFLLREPITPEKGWLPYLNRAVFGCFLFHSLLQVKMGFTHICWYAFLITIVPSSNSPSCASENVKRKGKRNSWKIQQQLPIRRLRERAQLHLECAFKVGSWTLSTCIGLETFVSDCYRKTLCCCSFLLSHETGSYTA